MTTKLSSHPFMCCKMAATNASGRARGRPKSRHWTREETLNLISVWGEPRYQRQFEDMVHNHTVWEAIYKDLMLRSPTVQDFGEWTKIKERLDYLRKGYRSCLKNNKKTGSQPMRCPYFEELDAVLGCRPMNNPGVIRMDRGSSDDEASECSGVSMATDPNTSREDDAEDDAATSADSGNKAPPPLTVEPKPQAQRRRKGRKTQIMEALEKGLDRLAQNDNTHDYEKERLEWEKEVERNRMELENKRLDFEMKRMETEDRRAKENRELMLQLFQCLRPLPPPPFSPYMAPHHFPYPPAHQGPSAEKMEFSATAPGPPAPAARQVHYYNDSP